MWSNGNPWEFTARGNVKQWSHFGKQTGRSLKRLNMGLPNIWHSNSTPGIYPRGLKTRVHTRTCTWMNVHSIIIHNSRTLEITQRSTTWKMDKQNVIYPSNGILFTHKKEWRTDTCYNMDGPWKAHAKWRNPDTETTYCLIPCIWNSQNQQIWKDRKQISACLGLGEGRGMGSDLMSTGFLLGWWECSKIDSSDGYTALWIYLRLVSDTIWQGMYELNELYKLYLKKSC